MLSLSLVTWHEARAFDRQHKEVYAESASDHSGNINSGLSDKDTSAGAFGESLRKREAEAEKRKRLAEEEAKQKEAEERAEAEEAKLEAENSTPIRSNVRPDLHGEGNEEAAKREAETLGTFEMTAYVALCDSGCTGVTATGYDVRNTIYSPEGLRIVAADPSVLPFGTVIEISSGGNTFQAIVMDSGGAIKGNRLDLLVGSESEAWDFGRQGVEVRVLSY